MQRGNFRVFAVEIILLQGLFVGFFSMLSQSQTKAVNLVRSNARAVGEGALIGSEVRKINKESRKLSCLN